MRIKIISTVLASLFCCLTYAQQRFSLQGKIAGNIPAGSMVYLNQISPEGQETRLDSALIKKNSFHFQGSIAQPALRRLLIIKGKKEEAKKAENWLASTFYLDIGNISYEGHIDSLPTYYYRPNLPQVKPIISGSNAQLLLESYERSIRPTRIALGKLDQEYLQAYHLPTFDNVFNTAEGVALTKAIKPLQAQVNAAKWAFIKANPASVVALDKAMEYFQDMYSTLSVPEIEELLQILEKDWAHSQEYATLKAAAKQAQRTAIGAQYIDGEIFDNEDQKHLISTVFPKDKKYILLEFWASWCGPCRGEIPHLKHTYEAWKDKGFEIISISLDEKEKDWKKAMQDEGMSWHQYRVKAGFEDSLIKAYNIQGIPYALLIDSDGKIVRYGMRGASLDLALEELL